MSPHWGWGGLPGEAGLIGGMFRCSDTIASNVNGRTMVDEGGEVYSGWIIGDERAGTGMVSIATSVRAVGGTKAVVVETASRAVADIFVGVTIGMPTRDRGGADTGNESRAVAGASVGVTIGMCDRGGSDTRNESRVAADASVGATIGVCTRDRGGADAGNETTSGDDVGVEGSVDIGERLVVGALSRTSSSGASNNMIRKNIALCRRVRTV